MSTSRIIMHADGRVTNLPKTVWKALGERHKMYFVPAYLRTPPSWRLSQHYIEEVTAVDLIIGTFKVLVQKVVPGAYCEIVAHKVPLYRVVPERFSDCRYTELEAWSDYYASITAEEYA